MPAGNQEDIMLPALYQKTLDYLYSLVDMESRHELSPEVLFDLRRMERLLAEFGNPHLQIPCVHIAGTKGKGSTAAMIASVLAEAGQKTGLYTSPHLIDLTERFKIDGTDITPGMVVDIVTELQPIVDAINVRAEFGCLTTFEVLTAMAFIYFARSGAAFQVIETGLGGRLDATNVVCPDVAVITLIGLDHTGVLGDTLSRIAGEKAGIIKTGATVVSASQPAEAALVIRETCNRMGASMIEAESRVNVSRRGYSGSFQVFDAASSLAEYHIELPLMGSYQTANLACVLACLEALVKKGYVISKSQVEQGLKKVKWPGRFQILAAQPLLVADGAHNPEAIGALMKALEDYLTGARPDIKRRTLILGASRDKDIAGMAAILHNRFDRVLLVRSDHPRAAEPETIGCEFARYGKNTEIAGNVARAVKSTMTSAARDELVLVTGSLFVVGNALSGLRNEEPF